MMEVSTHPSDESLGRQIQQATLALTLALKKDTLTTLALLGFLSEHFKGLKMNLKHPKTGVTWMTYK